MTYIPLRKTRDLGDLFNDLFAFLRSEFKPLMMGIALVGGIPFLLLAIPQVALIDTFMGLARGGFQDSAQVTLGTFILILGGKLYFTSLIVAYVNAYLRMYLDSRGAYRIEMRQVLKVAFSKSPKAVVLTIIYGLITGIATLFFILPGIYVAVVFALCFSAALADDHSISSSLDRSSKLIKDNWWYTLLIYIVLYVIMSVLNNIVSIPVLFTGLFEQLLHPENVVGVETNVGFWIASIFAEFASAFFFVILYLGLGIYYYSRVEAVESIGLLEQIKGMGKNNSSEDEVKESY